MNVFKLSAAAALVAASLSASAMTSIADEDLSAVSGQDGVSIAANLNINIGAFTYTDNADAVGNAASVSFNNITVSGLVAMTIDVVSNAAFEAEIAASPASVAVPTLWADLAAAKTVTGGAYMPTNTDVVQFAFPVVGAAEHALAPTIQVGSITMGNGASFGGVTIKNMDLQGTTVWMWAH